MLAGEKSKKGVVMVKAKGRSLAQSHQCVTSGAASALTSDATCAVDFDADARDEGGFVAGQVQGGIGDVQRGRKAAQWNRRQSP